MSRKSPRHRRRIRKQARIGRAGIAKGFLLVPTGGSSKGQVLSPVPDDDAIPSGPVTRSGWLNTHPRFHDPLHATRKVARFRPWYGDHNEHKPPKK